MRLIGLRRAVGDVVRAGEHAFLVQMYTMSPPIACSIMIRAASRETRNDPRAITSCWRSQSATVVSSSGLEIDSPALFTTRSTPPKAKAAPQRPLDLGLVGHVGGDRHRDVRTADLGCDRGGALASLSATTTHAPSAASRCAIAWPIPGASAGHERHPGGQRLGLGHALELGFLEGPVLDAELLRLAIGAYVEIASAPRITLIALT